MFVDYHLFAEQTIKDLRAKVEPLVKSGDWVPIGDVTAIHNPKQNVTEYILQVGKLDRSLIGNP